MQRSNYSRWAPSIAFTVIVLFTISLICGGFLLTDTDIPNWFVIAGRWIPAVVAVGVLLAYRQKNWASQFRLRSSWRQAAIGSAIAVGALLLTYCVAAVFAMVAGVGQPQSLDFYLNAALIIIPSVILFSLSTLGEEATWRGFLQQSWAPLGFWRASAAIATLWVIFHIPLHGAFVLQGTLPLDVAMTSTLTLIPLGLFLSAVSVRFGSAWPAVFAHALPLSALNLILFAGDPQSADHWIVAGITSALLIAAAYLFAPKNKVATASKPAQFQASGQIVPR